MRTEMFTDIPGVLTLADAYRDAMWAWAVSADRFEHAETYKAAWKSDAVAQALALLSDDEVGAIGYAARTSSFAKDVRGFVYGYKLSDTTQMLSNRQLNEGWAKAAVAYFIMKGAL